MSRLQDLVRQILGKEPKQTNDTAKTATNLLQQPIQNAVGAAQQGFQQVGDAYTKATNVNPQGNPVANFAKTMLFPQQEENQALTKSFTTDYRTLSPEERKKQIDMMLGRFTDFAGVKSVASKPVASFAKGLAGQADDFVADISQALKMSKGSGIKKTIREGADNLFQLAKNQEAGFANDISALAGDARFVQAPQKTSESIFRKAVTEKGGNLNDITDLNRGTIFIDSFDNIGDFLGKAKQIFGDRLISVRDDSGKLFKKGMAIVKGDQGLPTEIQFTTESLHNAKLEFNGHKLYEVYRDVDLPKNLRKDAEVLMSKLYGGAEDSSLLKSGTSFTDHVYENVKNNGGITIDLVGGQPSNGYAYSPFKDVEFKVPANDFSPKHIDNFVNKNFNKLVEKGNHLGVWEEGGQIYFDISKVGAPTTETIQNAVKNKQLAVYDLSNFNNIYTELSDKFTGY
jgi:hypothetical protein